MSDTEKTRKFSRLMYHLTRAFLRMVPIVPGPELFDLVQDLQRSKSDLDEQVEDAIASLQKSTELVGRLEQGVKERSEKLSKLREEYEQYSKLAEIESDKASAIISQLERAVGSGKKRERWIALGINLIAGIIVFLAGVALNGPVRGFFAATANWVKSVFGGPGV